MKNKQMNHVIGKQTIDLQISPEQEASVLQHQFSQFYWQDIVPAMEQLFNELAPPNEVIQIDRLEIDLGKISTMELQKEMILPLLRQALIKWFQHYNHQDEVLQRKPIERSVFEKWLFFLEKGYLPWSIQQLPENWTISILETLATNTLTIQKLRNLLIKSRYARQRLVQQHDSAFLQHVTETFTAKKHQELTPFATALASSEAAENFWELVIEKTLIQQEKWDDAALLKAYQAHQSLSAKSQKPVDPTVQSKNSMMSIEKEGIYIQNAGIILLHPFLPRFFKHCHLLEGNGFKDHSTLSKAIHLLHYMATNETQPGEQELSLLKFLCGLPINVPVEKNLRLGEEEKEEADALLQAAIKHWGALGAVTNASLQEAFLQREGKLEQTQSGWKLQMERKTLDILLNQLPWSINIIKLPWMEEMLKIDWI